MAVLLAALDPLKVEAVVAWITAIPFEEWNQQKPHGTLPLKPAMMSDHMWRPQGGLPFGDAFDPIVDDLMMHYPGCLPWGRMLSVVMDHDSIPPHRDEQDPNKWIIRVHVPLMTNDESFFIVEGEPIHMEVGNAYEVDTRQVHAVENHGETPRVHFMFDVMRIT